MEDRDRIWFDFTEKYVEKLHSNDNDWNALSEREQELAALWKLEVDMNNGGFMQFFCNWGFDCYKFAIRGLKNINANNMRRIVEAEFLIVDSVYKKHETDVSTYADIGRYISAEEFSKLDALDEEFWEYPDNTSELGFKYYDIQELSSET